MFTRYLSRNILQTQRSQFTILTQRLQMNKERNLLKQEKINDITPEIINLKYFRLAAQNLLFEFSKKNSNTDTLSENNKKLSNQFHIFIQGKEIDLRESAAIMSIFNLIDNYSTKKHVIK